MIPSTLLGLALFLASIGPGFAHVLIAEWRRPRLPRTQLAELAEYTLLGAGCTVFAGGLLLLLGQLTGALDAGKLLTETSTYFKNEPGRTLAYVLLSLGLSYAVAIGSAFLIHKTPTTGSESPAYSHSTSWAQAMFLERPSDQHPVIATVYLKGGLMALGVVGGFTATADEDRELRLRAPIAVRYRPGEPLIKTKDAFLLLRERDILWIAGRYKEPKSS